MDLDGTVEVILHALEGTWTQLNAWWARLIP